MRHWATRAPRSAWSACCHRRGAGRPGRRWPLGRAHWTVLAGLRGRFGQQTARNCWAWPDAWPRCAYVSDVAGRSPPSTASSCGRGLRGLRPCHRVAGTLAFHPGRHRPRRLRRHVGGGLFGLVPVLRSRIRAARLAGQAAGRAVRRHRANGGPVRDGRGQGLARRGGGDLDRPPGAAGAPGRGRRWGPAGPGRTADGAAQLLNGTVGLVGRFSTMAGISFAGVLVAGTLLAIAEVGSVANLFETSYGQTAVGEDRAGRSADRGGRLQQLFLVPGLLAAAAARADPRPGRRVAPAPGHSTARGRRHVAILGRDAVPGQRGAVQRGHSGRRCPSPGPGLRRRSRDLHITPNQALVNNITVQFTGPNGAPAGRPRASRCTSTCRRRTSVRSRPT